MTDNSHHELSLAAQTALDQVDPSGLSDSERRTKAANALRHSSDRLRAMDPLFCEMIDRIAAELDGKTPQD